MSLFCRLIEENLNKVPKKPYKLIWKQTIDLKFWFKTNKTTTRIETENNLSPSLTKGTANLTFLFFGEVIMMVLHLP